MLRKKWYLISLILTLMTSACYAEVATITAYQKCGNFEYPVRDGHLFIVNFKQQFFTPTNSAGDFTLDDEHNNDVIMAYLATEDNIIYAGCRSELVETSGKKVVLGGLCPSRNCGA